MMRPLEDFQRVCAKLTSERAHALRCLAEEGARLAECEKTLAELEEAAEIVRASAARCQQEIHSAVAGVVTRCLSAVFGEGACGFEIVFERKRGRTEARLVFTKDGNQIDPLDASGGGVVDVAAFALRVACLMLAKPPLRKLLVLDEPFRHLSAGYRPAARVLIEKLASETGIQFVVVTHDDEFRIGNVVEIG